MGLLNPIYEAVAWVLKQIYNFLSPIFGTTSGWTWALSIVILVVLMRLIMVPLFVKQMHTTRAMSALAPQMQALRKKYKNDKQTLQQETMKLYQQAGVNPLMGCLPVVLQLPMFFALYSVLKAIAEWKPGEPAKYGLTHQMVASAQQAKILGATVADKFLFTGTAHVPLHAKAVILVAVLISMTTTFLTVRQSMKRGMMPAATPDNPMGQSQKYMMYIMPFFALSGLYWPFGLVLYWVTTNCWTLLQQWVLFRRFPQPAAAGAAGAVASPAVAPAVTTRPKRQAKPLPAAPAGQDGAGASGAAETNGAAKPAADQPSSNGATPGKNRKAASQPSPPAKTSGSGGTARAGAQPSANGGGAGGVLRRLGKRAEPEPEPPAPEVKLVRQQRQRQSRSKRSGNKR
ncbi:MAG TPA: membrane protein insertase YidC [Streptosporangiaceae bacterium]|nr:membrane protein insertase YidC [Streptosporangiaceae bacterium]